MSAAPIPAPIPADAIGAAVAAARHFLRSEGTGEQALLEQLAASAIQVGEAFTGLLLIRRAVDEAIPVAPGWRLLAHAPVYAITGVTGLPAAGYAIDIDGDGCGWVRVTQPGAATRVTVAYRAGLAAGWHDLPAPIAQATVALIAHLHDDRGGATMPPAAVAALWRPYRRLRLAAERRV